MDLEDIKPFTGLEKDSEIENKCKNEVIKLIFETYKDSSSQYEMSKICQNNSEIVELFDYLEKNENYKIIGFFGLLDDLKALLKNFLNLTDFTIQNYIEKMEKTAEGMFAIANKDKLIFFYKCDSKLFTDNLSFSWTNSLLIDYIRSLTDLCETIIIVPGEIKLKTPLSNPFRDTKTHSVSLFERTIQPHESITLKKINILNQDFYQFKIQSTNDHSCFIWSAKIEAKTEKTPVKRSIQNNLLTGEKDYWNTSSVVNMDIVKEQILKNWTKKKKFEKISTDGVEVIQRFIHNDENKYSKIENIQSFLDALMNKYKKEINELYNVYLENFFNDNNILNIIKDIKCEWNDPYDTAHSQCKRLIEILGKKYDTLTKLIEIRDPDLNKCYIHWDKKNSFKNYLDKCANPITLEEFKDGLTELRKKLIEEFLNYVQDKIEKYTEKKLLNVEMEIFELSIIRDTNSEIASIKIIRKPFNFSKDFPLPNTTDHNEVSVDAHCFPDGNGFAMIRNIPIDKSTQQFFRLDEKNSFDESDCYSSPDSRFVIDNKSNIYLVYDNKNKKAHRGKVNPKTGKFLPPTIVYNLYYSVIEGVDCSFKLEHIKSSTFLPGSDLLFIIDENNNFIEYNYINGSLRLVSKKINNGSSIEKQIIRPKDTKDAYHEVQSVPNGKCVLLRCESSIDVYDLNWNLILNIDYNLKNYSSFKTFIDKNSTILLIVQNDNKIDAYELQGFLATKTLEINYSKKEESNGFLLFDCFYMIQRKFGYQSKFIGAPSKQKLFFLTHEKNVKDIDTLDTYFSDLKVKSINLNIEELHGFDFESVFKKAPTLRLENIKLIITTRIPTHVATIEASNIFPLQNGKNIYDQITSWTESDKNSETLIEHIVSLIDFGFYEKILLEHKTPVKVIAIVGRQSGGKSYLLNRLTGSRFNVASTRCTDGIWMSLAYLDNQLFVVCDCEGLFSARRNDIEETKLCLTLCAVCDVLILNQDLSFNRYLNQLFQNFAKSCDRLSGKNVFKGTLMIVIRDVSSQDADGAYIEMISNIRQNSSQSKNSYLEKLFDGKIRGQCLHNFENDIFNEEIDDLRNWLVKDLKPKWSNGFEFLDTFKFVMAQVHTDDDTYLDMRRFKKVINQKEKEAIGMFMTGQGNFSNCEIFSLKFNQFTIDTEILIGQHEINFTVYSDFDQDKQYLIFSKILEDKIKKNYEVDIHNEWLKALNDFTVKLIEHRKSFVLKYITETINSYDSNFEADVEHFKLTLKTKLDNLMQHAYLCQRKCRLCDRVCFLELSHNGDCSCETDHLCGKQCEICQDEKQAICCLKFGHSEKTHKCNVGHVCGFKCEISTECKFTCNLDIGHVLDLPHNCKNNHRCKEKCSNCNAKCALDLEEVHESHICGLTYCGEMCLFDECNKTCTFPNHDHSRLIDLHQKSKLENLSELKCSEWGETDDIFDYHICSNEHVCKSICEMEGVCTIGFNVIEKVWSNDCNSFPYKYYEPVENRDKCLLKIPLYSKNHCGVHDCKKGSEHRCPERCPECKSFCRLPVNHEEKYHETNAHRNKECNIFVSQSVDTIKVKSEGISREYEVGESCKPEICSESCERRGRGHFHLIECPGEEMCPAKFSEKVKHSNDKWNPYPEKKFDLWQCEQYWHSLGWQPPVNYDVLNFNKGCSFYCGHPDHEETLSFCKKDAWHSDDHTFECVHNTFDTLEIVFCCDTTGSMSSYIVQSKSTIKRIINDLSEKIKNISMGFVAYRDHPPQDSSYVTLFQDLTDSSSLNSFIENLDAKGGGDEAEAVLDGLYDAIFKTTWSTKKSVMKYLIHIADAPPHGKEYSCSSDAWPEGCPCGHSLSKISQGLLSKGIKYKLMKIGSGVNTMASIFKSNIASYEESELNGSIELDDKVVSFLARDLLNTETDFRLV